MKKQYFIFMFFFCSSFINLFAQDSLIFKEIKGLVAVEAEHFSTQSKNNVRSWYVFSDSENPNIPPDHDNNHSSSASVKGYIEILPDTRVTHDDPLQNGVNFSNTAGQMGIISYYVDFETTGKYYVWARIYSTGTEDNGIHVGIDDTWPSSGNRMQWCDGKNQWTWGSKQRTSANHCGEPYLIYLNVTSTGVHKISFSMREDGVELDKWLLTTDRNYIPVGAGPDEVLISGGDTTPPTAPANFRADLIEENIIQLKWEPSVDEESSILNYTLFRDGQQISVLSDTATTYFDPNKEYDTEYVYELAAKNKWSILSEKAELTIRTLPDQTPPRVEEIVPTLEGNLHLMFSEKLDEDKAINIANYNLSNGAQILGAELFKDGISLLLEVTGHTLGENYTLTITNITDENGVIIEEGIITYRYSQSIYKSINEADLLAGAKKIISPGSLYLFAGVCPTRESEIKFTVNIPVSEEWYLWGRIYAAGGGNDPNTFKVIVDSGDVQKLGNNQDYFNQWHWGGDGTEISGIIKGLPLGNLSEGEHEIKLMAAEPVVNPGSERFYLDGIYLSTQGDFSPSDGILATDIIDENSHNLLPIDYEFDIKTYPNPFNPTVNIEFYNQEKLTNVEIYNSIGQKVHEFANITSKVLEWDASNHSSGTFIIRAISGSKIKSSKVLLLK